MNPWCNIFYYAYKICNYWNRCFHVYHDVRDLIFSHLSILNTTAHNSTQQHTTEYNSIQQHTTAYNSTQQHTTAYNVPYARTHVRRWFHIDVTINFFFRKFSFFQKKLFFFRFHFFMNPWCNIFYYAYKIFNYWNRGLHVRRWFHIHLTIKKIHFFSKKISWNLDYESMMQYFLLCL